MVKPSCHPGKGERSCLGKPHQSHAPNSSSGTRGCWFWAVWVGHPRPSLPSLINRLVWSDARHRERASPCFKMHPAPAPRSWDAPALCAQLTPPCLARPEPKTHAMSPPFLHELFSSSSPNHEPMSLCSCNKASRCQPQLHPLLPGDPLSNRLGLQPHGPTAPQPHGGQEQPAAAPGLGAPGRCGWLWAG